MRLVKFTVVNRSTRQVCYKQTLISSEGVYYVSLADIEKGRSMSQSDIMAMNHLSCEGEGNASEYLVMIESTHYLTQNPQIVNCVA